MLLREADSEWHVPCDETTNLEHKCFLYLCTHQGFVSSLGFTNSLRGIYVWNISVRCQIHWIFAQNCSNVFKLYTWSLKGLIATLSVISLFYSMESYKMRLAWLRTLHAGSNTHNDAWLCRRLESILFLLMNECISLYCNDVIKLWIFERCTADVVWLIAH